MSRPPFNPQRAGGSLFSHKPARREKARYGHAAAASQLTVTQACGVITRALEDRVPSPIRVVGEVSNLKTANHWYFSLKDEQSVLGCVAWASSVKKFKFTPKDGDEIVATGHVGHYNKQGRTQLYVRRIEPVGAGALELRFREMCEELRGLGYFQQERKKPLPTFARRIAVVTSATSAAVRDVIATAGQRCNAVELVIVDVRVQGDGAAEQIAQAIRTLNNRRTSLNIDGILVTRGGGSIEDLWAFNERIVADAVYESALPIVAAIGHESDTTVIELVADLRAATPTQAAMRLIPSAQECGQQVAHLDHRLTIAMMRTLEQRRERIDGLMCHPFLSDPVAIVEKQSERLAGRIDLLRRVLRERLSNQHIRLGQHSRTLEQCRPQRMATEARQRVAVLSDRLRRAVGSRIDQHHVLNSTTKRLGNVMLTHHRRLTDRLDSFDRQLSLIGPHHVLERGFSYTTTKSGELIRSTGDVRIGQPVITNVADGSFQSIVGQSTTARRKIRAHRASRASADQLDLFEES